MRGNAKTKLSVLKNMPILCRGWIMRFETLKIIGNIVFQDEVAGEGGNRKQETGNSQQ